MDTDWVVWPIFVFEALIFVLLFFKQTRRFLKVNMRAWVHIGLLIVCIAIAVSLLHDASDVLNLKF